MSKTRWTSPEVVADELTAQRVEAAGGCQGCDDRDDGILCRFHAGYREGCMTLLLKAMLS